MLTKKDYWGLVEVIRSVKERDDYYNCFDLISKSDLVSKLMGYLQSDNPRFDRNRFLKAIEGGK